MAKLTKEEFITEVKNAAGKLRKVHPEWRKGQAIFNIVDNNPKYLGVAQIVQFQYHIDCFFVDERIEDFLDKCYEVYSMRYNQMNAL